MIEDGKRVKGGVNDRPKSKRPPPPKGQGGFEKQLNIPILIGHNQGNQIGRIYQKESSFFFEFSERVKITEEMLSDIFGGIGFKVEDYTIEGESRIIKSGQILEFSWNGVKPHR
jgi:hypothetical protein